MEDGRRERPADCSGGCDYFLNNAAGLNHRSPLASAWDLYGTPASAEQRHPAVIRGPPVTHAEQAEHRQGHVGGLLNVTLRSAI
ncbi:unnamed protein product [Ectocarpus sp. 6 AP-2014]